MFTTYYDKMLAKCVIEELKAKVILKMLDLECTTQQRKEIEKVFNDMVEDIKTK